ncbi:barstar family protein [Brenneria sp. 4F2]|nr:barstar family protein [Brenneria bubanii]
MKLVILDGKKHKRPTDVYKYFAMVFDFGPYFGKSSDALYDFMVPIDNEDKPLILEWRNSSIFKDDYPEEFVRLLSVFNRVNEFSGFNEGVFKFNLS